MGVVVPKKMPILGRNRLHPPNPIPQILGHGVVGHPLKHPMWRLGTLTSPPPGQPVIKVTNKALVPASHTIQRIFVKTQISHWFGDLSLNQANQVELLARPQQNKHFSVTACEEDVALWVASEGVDAVGADVFAVAGVVDQLGVSVEGEGCQEGVSIDEVVLL